jgi:hypothetical protein
MHLRFTLCRSAKTGDIGWASVPENWNPAMNDAQIGLVITTPIIAIFSTALYKMGVLQRYSAIAAVIVSVAIAVFLFTQQ